MRRWSIRYAASRAGIAHTTWSRVEHGALRTDRYLIAEFAAALECAVSDLTGAPYTPADRALETAHAHLPRVWAALVEIAPDEPPARPAPAVSALVDRLALVSGRRLAGDYAAVTGLLPDLLADLHAATASPGGRAAAGLMVDALHTTVLTLRHLGLSAEPALAAERCRQVAEQIGDPVPLAVADWTRAHAALATGSYARVVTLTGRAVDDLAGVTAPAALEVTGMLHLTSAVATLAARDAAPAHDHLAEAGRIATLTGESAAYTMMFGPANIGVWRMQVETDAGHPDRAVATAATLDTAALSTSRRASYHVELARALVDVGRDRDAVRHLLTAERGAPQLIRSWVTARETARHLLTRARTGESALRGLCERVGVAG